MDSFRHIRQRVMVTAIVCTRGFVAQLAFGVSAIVEDEAGRVVLIRPRLGAGWALPGGGVGAHEPPEDAILREAREEVGLIECGSPELLGLYTRPVAWATNLVALYRLPRARIAFKPNLEVREAAWVDPEAPPPGTQVAVARRLAEFTGRIPRRAHW